MSGYQDAQPPGSGGSGRRRDGRKKGNKYDYEYNSDQSEGGGRGGRRGGKRQGSFNPGYFGERSYDTRADQAKERRGHISDGLNVPDWQYGRDSGYPGRWVEDDAARGDSSYPQQDELALEGDWPAAGRHQGREGDREPECDPETPSRRRHQDPYISRDLEYKDEDQPADPEAPKDISNTQGRHYGSRSEGSPGYLAEETPAFGQNTTQITQKTYSSPHSARSGFDPTQGYGSRSSKKSKTHVGMTYGMKKSQKDPKEQEDQKKLQEWRDGKKRDRSAGGDGGSEYW